MASAVVEKTAEELRNEIDELHRQQREITERLRDPRGVRRSGHTPGGPRAALGARQRGLVRPTADSDDQPAPKRRLSSAVVRVDDGETKEVAGAAGVAGEQEASVEMNASASSDGVRPVNSQSSGGFRRDGNPWMRRKDMDEPPEPTPRVFTTVEDPDLVKRNRRMLGQLLGTLERFRKEDKQLSTTDAYMRRSDSLRRAEQKAREESERLRQQEREQIAEKRRRDLTLRARVAAKAEEKKLELLFLHWSEHHKMLCNFLRTKTKPPIFYMPTRPLVEDAAILEQQKEQEFLEWKSARRTELSEYQKQIGEQYLANVEVELERWRNARNARRANNQVNLQETMDKELEMHRLEHGPKTRRMPGSNEEEEDVEDIVAEDELMDDEVLEVHDRADADAIKQPEAGNNSPSPAELQ